MSPNMHRIKLAKFCIVTAFVAVMSSGTVAIAEELSLQERRARLQQERQLKSEAAYTANICGTSLRATINWPSTRNWPADVSIAEACDGALSAVEAVCREGNQARVAKEMHTFQCLGNGSGPALSGKVLSYGASPSGGGFDETRIYLERRFK